MSYARVRDQRLADQSQEDRTLHCAAHGCPNLWSVDPGHLCSAHFAADPADWPAVTDRQQALATDRAIADSAPQPAGRFRPPTDAERAHLRQAVRQIGKPKANPKAWAEDLRRREEAGDRLTLAQRTMHRDATRGADRTTTTTEEGNPW